MKRDAEWIRICQLLKPEGRRMDMKRESFCPRDLCEDVADLELANLRASVHPAAPAMLRLKGVRGAFIHGCRPTTPAAVFASVEGESRDILLSDNDLRLAKTEIETIPE